MILFDLLCSKDHRFEAWFRDSGSFDRLVAIGEIQCALCGDTKVRKALMAPNISTSKATDDRAPGEKAEEIAPPTDGSGPERPAAIPTDQQQAMAVQENAGPLDGAGHVPVPEKVAAAMRVLREVQCHVEKNFDHVGGRFAEEARKMHYGEAEKRSIYGEASRDEAEELAEEGIEINQMPWLTPRNS